MDAAAGKSSRAIETCLAENIDKLVAQLSEYRKENELLKSEVSSLQNILRSIKLPGTEGMGVGMVQGDSGNGFAYVEKLQIRQKLAMILQKIEREIRSDKSRL